MVTTFVARVTKPPSPSPTYPCPYPYTICSDRFAETSAASRGMARDRVAYGHGQGHRDQPRSPKLSEHRQRAARFQLAGAILGIASGAQDLAGLGLVVGAAELDVDHARDRVAE